MLSPNFYTPSYTDAKSSIIDKKKRGERTNTKQAPKVLEAVHGEAWEEGKASGRAVELPRKGPSWMAALSST